MKNKIRPNCLRRVCGYQLGEVSNTSLVVFGAERVKKNYLPEYLILN